MGDVLPQTVDFGRVRIAAVPLGYGVALKATCRIINFNNTRQGYALRSTLKPAGYFFPGAI
jgi:hypothetical protein